MKAVTLRTGKVTADVLVSSVMLALRKLLEMPPEDRQPSEEESRLGMLKAISFYELVKLCKDKTHIMWPGTPDLLRGYGLIDSANHVHEATREIVLAAVRGTDPEYRLGDPYHDDVEEEAKDNA
jgi:hypothetical protein